MENQKRADIIFEKINEEYKDQKGKIVAIEPESGDFFIDEDELVAVDKAKVKHPTKLFYLKRIGYDAVYFVGAYNDEINKGLFQNLLSND
tara:strand:+ start:852 stop:1121 length:270 start_codon:yes stop_codon:yes gene_type:complete